ncbi:MAG: J domain-containing protein [Spirochaetaceae bacterium]|nr:J domain-containing protein [Spirochaetaceae bacterium]
MPRQRRYYTLASLIDAQPAGLVKDSRHRLLWDHFMSSQKLQKLRISRRCYSLLNKARIKPENLPSFYRTYRLPRDSFFPLFLAVKSKWIEDRRQWREDRKNEIQDSMNNLPEQRIEELQILAVLEKNHHPSDLTPIWDLIILPKTKKRVQEIKNLSEIGWWNLYSQFLTGMRDRYSSFSNNKALKYEALLILGFHLQAENSQADKQEIISRFRVLSKTHHPDRGGNSQMFRRLKTARDVLLNPSPEYPLPRYDN